MRNEGDESFRSQPQSRDCRPKLPQACISAQRAAAMLVEGAEQTLGSNVTLEGGLEATGQQANYNLRWGRQVGRQGWGRASSRALASGGRMRWRHTQQGRATLGQTRRRARGQSHAQHRKQTNQSVLVRQTEPGSCPPSPKEALDTRGCANTSRCVQHEKEQLESSRMQSAVAR